MKDSYVLERLERLAVPVVGAPAISRTFILEHKR